MKTLSIFNTDDKDKEGSDVGIGSLFNNESSVKTKSDDSLSSLFNNDSSSKSDDELSEMGQLFGNNTNNLSSDTKNIFSANTEDVHFCRDCKYLITNPFECRCSLTRKTVRYTDDCPSFIAKEANNETK